MKTCSVRSKRRDQYQSDNRETNDNLEEATIFTVLVHRTDRWKKWKKHKETWQKKTPLRAKKKKHAYKLNQKINIYMQLKSFPTLSPSLFQSVT